MLDLPLKARIYLVLTYLAALPVLATALIQARFEQPWLVAALSLAAALTLIFKVNGPTSRSHYAINLLVYAFSFQALGLPETLVVILVSNLVEWLWTRPPWFAQALNTACYVLATFAASTVYVAVNPTLTHTGATELMAILLWVLTFTLLNHLMVGAAMWFARGENFAKSGVFDLPPLMIDATLLCLGSGMVIVWDHDPFNLLVFLPLLYLLYGALRLPQLERQTETDAKTGLSNNAYFMRQLENELRRANRFDRPLSLIMIDLDLLRLINNTYGHLAGDDVLVGIAAIMKRHVRDYDVVARYGGEEFAILMPEARVEAAIDRAEKVRLAIEKAEFGIPTSVSPLKATVSIGVATRERLEQPAQEIIHNADRALYRSKQGGRNRTHAYTNGDCLLVSPPGTPQMGPPIPDAAEELSPVAARLEAEAYRAAAASLVQRGTQVQGRPPVPQPATDATEAAPAKTVSARWVNPYIALLAAIAGSLFLLVSRLAPRPALSLSAPEGLSLAAFAFLVVVTEWFAVELYVRKTTVSTSAVPMLAGTLLYGPVGGAVLGATYAVTALIKYRSPFSRVVFNFSNQVIAAMLYLGLITLTGKPFTEWTVGIQIALCLMAALVSYLSSSWLVAVGVGLNLGQSPVQLWKDQYAWLTMSYFGMGLVAYALIFGQQSGNLLGILLVVVPLWLLRLGQKQYMDRTRALVDELRHKQQVLEETAADIHDLNTGLLDTISEVIDLGDPTVLGHSRRVTAFATQIAALLGIQPAQIQQIRNASLLHDIGKLGIPLSILSKTEPLSAGEQKLLKTHPRRGADLVDKSLSLRSLAPIIRHHHERYDGKGYPDGLKGTAIPIAARVIAVADAIEAMLSNRPYHKAMPTEAILTELEACSGTQFDPLVVTAAVTHLKSLHSDFVPEGHSSVQDEHALRASAEPASS